MDLDDTDDDLACRDRVRAFLDAALPPDLRRKVRDGLRLQKDDYVRRHRIPACQGIAVPVIMAFGSQARGTIELSLGDSDHHLARFIAQPGVDGKEAA